MIIASNITKRITILVSVQVIAVRYFFRIVQPYNVLFSEVAELFLLGWLAVTTINSLMKRSL